MITEKEFKQWVDGLNNNRPSEQIFGNGCKIILKKRKKNNIVDVTLQYLNGGSWLTLWKGETKTPIPKGDADDILADIELELEQLIDDTIEADTLWYKVLTDDDKEECLTQMKELLTGLIDILSVEISDEKEIYAELLKYGVTKHTLDLLEVDI